MNKNKPAAKGIRTFIQAVPGFIGGYFVTIWAVPGVSDATVNYLKGNGIQLLLTLGISSALITGLVSFLQNKVEDK